MPELIIPFFFASRAHRRKFPPGLTPSVVSSPRTFQLAKCLIGIAMLTWNDSEQKERKKTHRAPLLHQDCLRHFLGTTLPQSQPGTPKTARRIETRQGRTKKRKKNVPHDHVSYPKKERTGTPLGAKSSVACPGHAQAVPSPMAWAENQPNWEFSFTPGTRPAELRPHSILVPGLRHEESRRREVCRRIVFARLRISRAYVFALFFFFSLSRFY